MPNFPQLLPQGVLFRRQWHEFLMPELHLLPFRQVRHIVNHRYLLLRYFVHLPHKIDNFPTVAPNLGLMSQARVLQLEKDSPRIYVNLPKSRKIAVLDRDKRTILATWPLGMMLANYAMALDQANHRLFVITRYPARLLVFDTVTGKTVQRLPVVVDCDDVFYDQAGKRIYAIGGEGAISVFDQQDPDHYKGSARIITVKGARTGFFHPNLTAYFWQCAAKELNRLRFGFSFLSDKL